MPTLFLVRHAEPALTGVLLGRLDPPLSEAGRAQADGILAGISMKLAAVYCSPLLRARETADAMSSRAPIILDELLEIGYGDWDGNSWSEIERRWPDLARAKQDDWFGVTPPDGERWVDFRTRVVRAAGVIRRGPLPAAVVAHAAVNAVLAEEFAGADPLSFQQSYGEVLSIEI